MSHRLGSLLTQAAPFVVGPASGALPTSPHTWESVFAPASAPGGTKFLMLHLTTAGLTGGDRVEVDLGYDTDVFTAASGLSFWTRPVAGNAVTLRYVDDGVGPPAGSVSVTEYGRGEGLKLGGANGVDGGNTNADLFLLDSPYTEPTYFLPSGTCPAGSNPSWENADCLPAGLMRDTARSVGMFVLAHAGDVSSCSASLIGPDMILTAGHCIGSQADADTASFTLGYQSNCDGTRPAGYAPMFHKLTKVVKVGFARAAGDTRPGLDYSIVQFDAGVGGVGAPPLTMRSSFPAIGEELFVVHHPRGVTKKVSRKPADPTCQVLSIVGPTFHYACDSDNGSSGSPVLDLAGRIVAVNDWAPGSCNNHGQASSAIVQDFVDPVPPVKDVDVVLVLDRSGSMSLTGLTGSPKMTEAKRAAALFLDLIRTDRAHRAAVVSFSDTVTLDAALLPTTPAQIDTLIGPAPTRSAGTVGGIAAGGWTSIGGGLQRATQQLPSPLAAVNSPAILLMTDGLQNTPPMIADVEPLLGATRVVIVGFGGAGDLDGPLLSQLAARHGGLYTRAGEGLSLKKFFVLAFGNIFQTGVSLDPFYVIAAGATQAPLIPFGVCGEDSITVVLGWARADIELLLSLTAPSGTVVTPATVGLTASRGDTWAYLRIPLPLNGERDGTWVANVTRVGGGGELAMPLPEERFFVTTVVDGGPIMRPPPARRYYTGDAINPLVSLRYPDGSLVDGATLTLEVEGPAESVGTILAREGLRQPTVIGGEQFDARASALIALEQARAGQPLVPTQGMTFPLFDDPDDPGTLEPDGQYGNPLKDLMRHEGHYGFRARAEFGSGCRTARETAWSAYVSIGIDPGRTDVVTTTIADATLPAGQQHVRITFTPKDRFGNYLGPGRAGDLSTLGTPGSQLLGPVTDSGNGSYVVDVAWDRGVAAVPGITIVQPDRPPVIVAPPGATPSTGRPTQCLTLALIALVVILVIALIWALTH